MIRPGYTQIINENNFDIGSGTPQSFQKRLDDNYQYQVLIAEDNEMIQQTMKMMLESQNVVHEICWNGLEAVEKFEEYMKAGKMFDVILMDIFMPQMDGF